MGNLTAFLSYSHDSKAHKDWVLNLANRLVKSGVDIVLDQFDLRLGSNLPAYMEGGVSTEHRVICVCTKAYVEKANSGQGGVGYEKMIMTGELLKNVNVDWIIPIVISNPEKELPKFLSGKLYEDFSATTEYEEHFETLLRELLDIPKHPKPLLGQIPFIQIKETGRIIFKPRSEKFHSPGYSGTVTFDHSSNNSRYTIGDGDMLFELHCSQANEHAVHCYNYPDSIDCIAVAYGVTQIREIVDSYGYDYTSDHRQVNIGEIVIWQNKNGYFAATKILKVEDRHRNSTQDRVTFEYRILTNTSSDFSK